MATVDRAQTAAEAQMPGDVLAQVDAEAARNIADEFLIRKVGDLLGAGTPRLSEDGQWAVPILLGNVAQGMLGEVGTITVVAASGQVVFSEEDRARVAARAKQLVDASAL
jgi:hypothetical protein